MEATVSQALQFSTWIQPEKFGRKPSGPLPVSGPLKDRRNLQVLVSACFTLSKSSNRCKNAGLVVSCSYKNFAGPVIESEKPSDEALLLESKSEEVEAYLNGQCIYLVGMMGSGKTTVGKILSEALGYTFEDSDTFVEKKANGLSVADIFKHLGENFFRNKETEVLRDLSQGHKLVISTGGGAVIRAINWNYMNKGVSVWLDVPLEALARRIAAVGTGSRPLLHQGSGDVYKKTLGHLSNLFKERGDAYGKANARVSLEHIAAKLGQRDVCDITPTAIAIESLEQIHSFLKKKEGL